MKTLTFFAFAGLVIAGDVKLAPLSKTDLLAIDNIAQRAAAVDRDKQELIAEICGKINTTAENCSIDTDKKTVSTKPAPKPEDARPPVKNTVK